MSALLSRQQHLFTKAIHSSCHPHLQTLALHNFPLLQRAPCSCSGATRGQHQQSAAPRTAAVLTRSTSDLIAEPVQHDELAQSTSQTRVSRQQPDGDEQLPEMQLPLPPPTHTQVKTAEFIKSSVTVGACPPAKHPEFAVIGRSNVGKSSLINMLTNRKSLAMVSKQPGKTKCINHFLINNSWYLVDLPGYGYARTGKENRKEFEWMTKNYFLQRPTLSMVLLLVDSSIPPQPSDLEYATWLGSKGVPFSLVFTKADKRKKGAGKKSENIKQFKKALLGQCGFTAVPPCIVTSAEKGDGKQELLAFIASLRILFENQVATGSR